jgi:hypothetical protein
MLQHQGSFLSLKRLMLINISYCFEYALYLCFQTGTLWLKYQSVLIMPATN